MSAYKLIEVVKTSEKETQSIHDKDDLSVAIADMENDFGVAVKTDDTVAVYCIIVSQETGEKVETKYWRADDVSDFAIRQRVYTHNDYADDDLAPYDSEKLAIGNFNTKMAASRKKAVCNFAMAVRIDSMGKIADSEVFHREKPQAE